MTATPSLVAPKTPGHCTCTLLLALEAAGPEVQGVRRRLLESVERYPGLHLRELSRMVRARVSQAEYHLHALESAGRVQRTQEQGYVRYWPVRASPLGPMPLLSPQERSLLQWFRRPAVLQVLVRLVSGGPQTLTTLAAACRVAPSAVHRSLRRLADEGLVTQERTEIGKSWRVVDADLVRRLLREYKPPPALVAGFLETWQRLAP